MGNYSDLYMQFFIDYNDDGDFLDANETIYNGKAAAGIGTTTFSFTTPSVLPVTNKLLRARVTTAVYQTSLNSCYNPSPTSGDGQIEDYGVVIECTSPTVPTFTSIAPICYGGTITLPTTSTNAITGTWLPAINNTATTTYTFKPTTGLCASNTTLTVTVNQNSATLSSAAGTNAQTKCVNIPITNITYTTTGATGIGTPTGLPSGVTASWSSNAITISGTPTQLGTFNYSIPLTGGCGSVSAT